MFFYKNASDKKPLFFADNRKIIIDGETFTNNEITDINVVCSLGRFFPARKNLKRIDELVDAPPLFKMTGSVEIKTLSGVFAFPKVYGVMEAYLFFKRIYSGTQAVYKYRKEALKYRYRNLIDDDFFEKRKNFTSVYILDDQKELDRDKILEMKNRWSSYCGFRRCLPEETCCFNEVLFFDGDDPWVTCYDDSVEGLTALGVISQCNIYSEEAKGRHIFMISVYEGEAMLLAHGLNSDISLYYCGDERFYGILRCDETKISKDYEALEALARVKTECSVKDIFESKNRDMYRRLTALAEKFEMNDFFVRAGFYDVSLMNVFEMREFANGYHSLNYRLRLDENSVQGLYTAMYQGNSAFDIIKADKTFRVGSPFTVSFKNIGRATAGIAFCIRSGDIHRAISEGMKIGDVPIKITNCRFTRIKEEFDKDEPQDMTVSAAEYAKDENAAGGIYENIPFEMSYRIFFGQYAFVFEGDDLVIPTGLVVNEKNIKTAEDRKKVDWVLERAAVNITFTLETSIPLKEDITLMLIPMENVYGGIGRYKITDKEVQK